MKPIPPLFLKNFCFLPVFILGLLLGLRQVGISAAEDPAASEESSVDEDILEKAPSMSPAELKELFQIYARKNDKLMAGKIKAMLNKVDAADPDTKNLVLPATPEAPPDQDDQPVPAEIQKARDLIADGKAPEAVVLLEKLQSKNAPGAKFPFAMDLASALDEAGQAARAIAAYESVLADAEAAGEDHQEARERLEALRMSVKLLKIGTHLDEDRPAEAQKLLQELTPDEARQPEAKILAARLKALQGATEAGESELLAISADSRLSEEVRKDARETLHDLQVSRLLKQGEGATKTGDRKLALKISEELYSLAPLRTEIVHFRARALLKNQQAPSALKILEQHAPATESEFARDHNQLLAEVLEHTGALPLAVASYRMLGADPKASLLEQCDALSSADHLAALGCAGVSGQWTFTDAEEGRWSVYHVTGQTGDLGHGLQFQLEGYGDAISPAAGDWSDQARDEQFEATAGARLHFGDQKFLQSWITGHEDGLGAGAAIGRQPVAGPGYQLRYDYQRRAADSLFLRSLNGRQNRLTGSVEADLGHGFTLDLQTHWRQVTVDQTSLGQGGGLEIALAKTLVEESRQAPGVVLSYLGEFSKFNSRANRSVFRSLGLSEDEDPARLNELVDPQINRQEIELSVHRHWSPKFETMLVGAIGYEFKDEQSVWRVGFQAAYRLDTNLRLTLQGDYDSSGQAANASGAVLSFSAGLGLDF